MDHSAYYAALCADQAYGAAIRQAGFSSRWELPANVFETHPAIANAYFEKVRADAAMMDAARRTHI